jgi:ubiquinone biosynthesis protein COQ9
MEELVARFIEISPILGITDHNLEHILRELNNQDTIFKIKMDVKSFLELADTHLTNKAIERTDLSIKSFSKKIEMLVWNKLMVYSEFNRYREFLKQKIKFGANPKNNIFALKQAYNIANTLWYAAGDKSTDFSFYTKRMTLSALYTAVLIKFSRDYSYQFDDTKLFLQNRINNIVSFTKFKSNIAAFLNRYN